MFYYTNKRLLYVKKEAPFTNLKTLINKLKEKLICAGGILFGKLT